MSDMPEICECCGADGADAQECFGHPLVVSEKLGLKLCWECLETNDYETWVREGGRYEGT